MRAFTQSGKLVITLAVALLCLSTAPGAVFADDGKDDKDKTSAPAKVAPAKTDPAAAGLTERERMLLDRVEQLEKRVAELEGKKDGGAPGAAAAAPGEANAVAATAPVTNAAPGNVATAASNSSTSVVKSADSGASATVAASPASAGSPASQDQTTPTNVAQVATNGKPGNVEPVSDADWTWLNGNPRTKDIYWDTKFFTPEIRVDTNYVSDFNHPVDHSIGGSSELFRSSEVQLEQLGVGGDFHYDNVRGRLMTQFGMYSVTTPRNDPSPGHGQWDLAGAYRYLAEAYGGYHINALDGINIDAGIFMSYIGLFSYYNFDNWAYQPSYVSSNTPWFFNGLRVQIFPNPHLKIEPWFINGWQSYGSANSRKGLGGQIKWTPRPWVNVISNNYGLGHDDLYIPNRGRIHTDDSIEIKYYDQPERFLDKMAFSFTGDMGCEFGPSKITSAGVYLQGVGCHGNTKDRNSVGAASADEHFAAGINPKQSFIGYMLYNRFWFKKDHYGLTVG